MKRSTRVCLIIAAALMLLGILLFTCAIAATDFNFASGFNTAKYETTTHEITEKFDSISVDTDTADINILPATDNAVKVLCFEQENLFHKVSVKDGTLTVELVDERRWFEHITFFNIHSPMINVYLPEAEYRALNIAASTSDIDIAREFSFESLNIHVSTGDVTCYASAKEIIKMRASTGRITLEDLSAGAIDITTTTGGIRASNITCAGDLKTSVSTGKTKLSSVTCKNLFSTGNTGDITLIDVIATERFDIERSTGDVEMEACDAAELIIITDTGDVDGSLLSEKVFVVRSDTGDIDVPKTTSGGICEITTDTGDIEIYVK